MRIYFIIFLLFPAIASADEWTRADTAREVAYQTLAVIDWAQTRNLARHPDKWYEHNRLLGYHPSVGRVNAYFALTGIAHYAVANVLPSRYRAPFQYVSIGIEIGAVEHNYSIGISAKF